MLAETPSGWKQGPHNPRLKAFSHIPKVYNNTLTKLKSSILSLTSSQLDQTFWGVVSAAVGRLGTWGVHLRYPFPLTRCIWFTIRATFKKKKLTKRKRSILPSPAKLPTLLHRAHNQEGHLSSNYTLAKLAEKYPWPYMARNVNKYMKSCETCAKTNPARPQIQEGLKSLQPQAHMIEDRINFNLLDMPKLHEGHIANCTLVDAATGFKITNPAKDKTSSGVADTLPNKYLPYFGCPKVLVTDQGKENVNSEISVLCEKYKIKQITSSVSHSQSNGIIKRRQQMILSFVNSHNHTPTNPTGLSY